MLGLLYILHLMVLLVCFAFQQAREEQVQHRFNVLVSNGLSEAVARQEAERDFPMDKNRYIQQAILVSLRYKSHFFSHFVLVTLARLGAILMLVFALKFMFPFFLN